ncbi:MAG: maleate cis-trans isomerase family protein [Nocardioidaceae bacterium]
MSASIARSAPVPGPAPQAGIGLVVPYDMALDRELWRWVPDDVSLYLTRTPFAPLPVSVEMAEHVADPAAVRNGVQALQAVSPGVVAYACTSGSFVNGVAGERRLVEAMADAGAPDALTTSGALVTALAALGARTVAVATPYDPDVTARLRDFLAGSGITVAGSAHLGLRDDIWKVPYATTADLVHEADRDAAGTAEAVVVSCTNLPTYDVITTLESALGKPVVTANQATIWAALRALGRRLTGSEQRLAGVSDVA